MGSFSLKPSYTRILGLVLGAAVGLIAAALGGTVGTIVLVGSLALLVAYWLYCRWAQTPRGIRSRLTRALDPSAGPPAGAQPADRALAERWVAAVNARDWEAAAALLEEEIVVARSEGARPRVMGRGRYLKANEVIVRGFADMVARVDEVLAVDGAPHEVWVRMSERGSSRDGIAIDLTWWERWTLTAGGDSIAGVTGVGVTRLGPTRAP